MSGSRDISCKNIFMRLPLCTQQKKTAFLSLRKYTYSCSACPSEAVGRLREREDA